MNEDIIQCRDRGTVMSSEPWKPGQIVNFMWMPSGVHTIVAGFRKGSIELTVQCDQSTVDAVQASLDGWRAERPKQECFGCVEHAEREASFRVGASCGFNWKQDGVYLTAEPTVLGAQNINGKIHRSWSPSFTTDAEYSKATEQNGVLVFPEGARGSRSNPARITGCDFCVGTITNRPAFHEIAPVKAREAGDAVTAAGTSEGVKKSWETRKNRASNLTTQADRAHYHAMHADTEQAHNEAAEAHDKAGAAHKEMQEHHSYAEDHEDFVNYHKHAAESHRNMAQASSIFGSMKSSPATVRAHCRLTLLQDVPDATDAEVAQYEKEVEGGGSHSDAVIKLRSARQNGFKTTGSEKPTLDTIAARHAAAVEAANRIAAERGAAKLTAADVYERFSVKAGAPVGNKNASKDFLSLVESHGYKFQPSSFGAPGSGVATHEKTGRKIAFDPSEGWAHYGKASGEGMIREGKTVQQLKAHLGNPGVTPLVTESGKIVYPSKATDATPEAILERIYARAGANR